jgi:DNA-binding transcriptional MerR regulator
MTEFNVDEPRYTRVVAAQLAEISLEFLERCETERLVRVRVIRGGAPGYSARDIRELARLGRLHEDLELDFPALEVVQHMRRQLLDLHEQMERLEREMVRREERLVRELVDLRRRLAAETDWS